MIKVISTSALLFLSSLIVLPMAASGGTAEVLDRSAVMQACAKACSDCQRACDVATAHCSKMLTEGKKEHAASLAMCIDCASVCVAASQCCGRSGPCASLQAEACAKACDQCAEMCDKHGDDNIMKACADECRKCAKACRLAAAPDSAK